MANREEVVAAPNRRQGKNSNKINNRIKMQQDSNLYI